MARNFNDKIRKKKEMKIREAICFGYIIIKMPFFGSSQEVNNTKSYFPYIDSLHTELYQTIKITTPDTTLFVYHKYEYLNENKHQYLISSTYDSDKQITTLMKERITKKGLKYHSGKYYEYNGSDLELVFEVKGRKKITFPFKPIDKMKNWKTKWRNTYDNKVIIKSKIEFIKVDSIRTGNEFIEVLMFKRTVKGTYKKEYEKEKLVYDYVWLFSKGKGMFQYVRKGDFPLEGIIIKNELKN